MAGLFVGLRPADGCSEDLPPCRRWRAGEQCGHVPASAPAAEERQAHRYFSVVENRRIAGAATAGGRPAQVLYLGEINDSQEAAWRKTLEVFDEQRRAAPATGPVPRRPARPARRGQRPPGPALGDEAAVGRGRFGDCWLGCWLWQQLELDRFWQERLEDARGEVPWEKVLQLLAVNRLIDPGSEFRLHRQWFLRSAMDELLQRGLRGGRQGPAVSLPGPPAGAQGRALFGTCCSAGRTCSPPSSTCCCTT